MENISSYNLSRPEFEPPFLINTTFKCHFLTELIWEVLVIG